MARPYSMDLRERVISALASGQTCREVAARFGISVSSVVKWSQRHRATGSAEPGQMGGHRGLMLLPAREWVLARLAAAPDLTLRGLVAELSEQGISASYGSVWRLLAAEGLTFKKKPARHRAVAA